MILDFHDLCLFNLLLNVLAKTAAKYRFIPATKRSGKIKIMKSEVFSLPTLPLGIL